MVRADPSRTQQLPFRPLYWEGTPEAGHLEIIDQRKLPACCEVLRLTGAEEVFEALRTLQVRGAPAIGAAAAYGVLLAARKGQSAAQIRRLAEEGARFLAGARPTAKNLFWALDRMKKLLQSVKAEKPADLLSTLLQEARAIEEEDRLACEKIGRNALAVLPDPIRAMTHCNAGALATCGIGTALAAFYLAHWEGRQVEVFVPETRPLLQGARLTAWELTQAGIPVTVVVDSARAYVLQRGLVNCVIVGADRIVRNGDTANKIGTYELAVAAKRHGIPFYVAAPASTFDLSLHSGNQIEIEERDCSEVLSLPDGSPAAPPGVPCFNPAFDVTPAELITAFVTEKGVLRPPYEKTILETI